MEASAGTAYVDFKGDFSSLNKQVAAYLGPLTSKFGKLGKAGAAGLGVVAGGAVAAGAALYDVGEEFDAAYDKIRVKTGATGKHLAGLKADFRDVVSDVPASFDEAGTAVGGLNQRLGLTGKPLQEVSKRVLELSRLTETDLSGNIASITRLFADWGVKTAQQPATLDKLWRASQATGIEIGKLSEYMVQFGSPLRQMGFDFDTAAAMFSKFEKEGVNLQTAMPGLRMALKNFAKDGKDPANALEATIKQIKNAGSTAEANTMAFDIFGTRAGPDLAAAIREGRLNFSELIHTIDGGKDSIMRAARETDDFSEKWQVFKNRVMVDLEPLANRVFGAVGDEMERIGDILTDPHLSNDEKFSKVFGEISDQASGAFSEIANQAGHYAPQAALAFVHGFLDADAWGKLVIGALIVRRLGGFKSLVSVGERLGMGLGTGVATGAGETVAGASTAGRFRSTLMTNLLGLTKGVGITLGAVGIMGGIQAGMESSGHGASLGRSVQDALFAKGGFYDQITFGAFPSGESWGEEVKKGFAFALKGINPEMGVRGVSSGVLSSLVTKEFKALQDAPKGLRPDISKWIQQGAGETIKALKPSEDEWNSWSEDMRSHWARSFNSAKSEILNLEARHGIQVPINLQAPQPGRAFKSLGDGLTFLKRGVGANMADINRVITRNMHLARVAAGGDMQAFRKLTAENMRAAADAIGKQMDRSGNKTKDGMDRIERLVRNANLIDATRQQAKGFGDEWAKGMDRSKQITRQGIQAMIAEAKKMPGPMREVALQTWLENIKQAKRSGDITVGEFRRMRSRVLSEFGSIQQGGKQQSKGLADGVIGNVSRLVNTTGSALGIFRDNVNAALKSFGVEAQEFTIKTVDAAGGGGEAKRQTGGIVPGSGDGDRPGFGAKAGSFVLNREATKAYGFLSGGIVPVALEAGERVFDPGEVQRIGRGRLEAMNQVVPRFHRQAGGSIGGPEPQILGPDPLAALGQHGVDDAYTAGMAYLKKHMGPKPGLGTLDGHPVSAWIIPILEWARQHGWGGSVTSGFRNPAEQMAAATGYGLQHYGAAGPLGSNHVGIDFPKGAVDVTLAAQLAQILQGYPGKPNLVWGGPVMGDLVHFSATGHQLGGLVQALIKGGGVLSPDEWAEAMLQGGFPSKQGVIAAGLGTIKSESSFDASQQAQGPSGHIGGWAESPAFGSVAARLDPVRSSAAAYKEWKKDGGFWQAWGQWEAEQSGLSGGGAGTYGPEYMDTAKKVIEKGGGSATGAHSSKEDVPATYHGCRTDSLNFGSMPKSLTGVKAELAKRRGEIRRYRKVAREAAKENKPAIEHALRANVTALEGWISKLEHERAKLRREAAQKEFSSHLGKKLKKLLGNEILIEGKERAFNSQSQFAEQLVDLEPLMAELPASATDAQREAAENLHVADLTAYIEGQEKPAYQHLLDLGADWRNQILLAEHAAAGNWSAKGKLGGLEGNWEDNTIAVDNEIDRINDLTKKVGGDVKGWQDKHPKKGPADYPDWLKDGIEKEHKERDRLPMLRFKDRELRKFLGEAREQFYPGKGRVQDPPSLPLPGSGAFEEALTNVQGIHWPDQHELLAHFPQLRAPGAFGGVLWDVQSSISELGLRISEATSSLGAGGGGNSDNSEYTQLLEELLATERGTKRLRAIEERTFGSMPPYAGKAHTGAIVPGPPNQEKTMIVRGQERIRTPEQELAMAESIRGATSPLAARGGPPVIEHLTIHSDGSATMRYEGEEFEAAVRKVTHKDGRREARGASRRLARAGRPGG